MSLDQTTLNGTVREAGGKGEARRLRVAGKIPAVIYGRTTKPVSVAVDPAVWRDAPRAALSLKEFKTGWFRIQPGGLSRNGQKGLWAWRPPLGDFGR